MSELKLYEISEEYISYISTVEKNVFSSKENERNHTRKYLGIVYSINGYNYYIPLSSPKNSDYRMENGVQKIRGSIVPIIRITSQSSSAELESLIFHYSNRCTINLLKRKVISQKSRTLQDSFRLFSFSSCYPAKTKVSYDTTEKGIGLEKDIVSGDGEYPAILRESDIYSGELDRMDLSKEFRLLIDRYVSEQNALGSRYGMFAYLLGFSDCKAMFLGKCLPTEVKEILPPSLCISVSPS